MSLSPTKSPTMSTWDDVVTRRRLQIKQKAPEVGHTRAWAEVKELMGDMRPATPPVVKRLLAPPKPSPRTTGWITRPVTQQSFSRPSPREATLPFAVNTITTRFSTTAHLYHDGIPGSPMTYFYDGL